MSFSRVFLCAAVSGLVIFGALNTLTTKIQLSLTSVGSVPDFEKPFQKPWFATFAMFAGMAFALVPYHILEARKPKMASDTEAKLLPNTQPALSERAAFCYVGIPAIFDLVASGLMFCGLIFISASIWQMLRGSEIVFAAIISVPALGHKLCTFHWVGVGLCVLGICAVGAASVLNAHATSQDETSSADADAAMFGMGLVVLAQVVQAAQVVAEEKLLKDVELPPMKVVGYEGIWGTMVCLLVVFPLCALTPGDDNGSLEDTRDTVTMIKNNPSLGGLIALYVFSCATYNVAGMMVTSELSAVHRTMLEASRTVFIWIVDLLVFYVINPEASFGEAWMPYSPLQLVGFFILLLGQMVYGGILEIPGLYYPPAQPTPAWQSPASLMALSPLPRLQAD